MNEDNDSEYWSLYQDGIKLEPLRYSNGKTQEDVVREVVDLIRSGKKVILIHGVCGTGKSAIALNIARSIGSASVVVPLKNLQNQYVEDYTNKKYLLKLGRKMKIAIITGRDNHDSIFQPGVSCADPYLPDTILLTEKNKDRVRDYYEHNPFISNKLALPKVHSLKRISVAPANPYWSPIVPADYVLNQLKDATQKHYRGVSGREYIFYHRKKGCSYYDQFQAYIDADITIFNSAKYNIEMAIGRKPRTELDIIDEADLFLDNFSKEDSINLDRLLRSLQNINPEYPDVWDRIRELENLIVNELKNKAALGVNENEIFPLKETNMGNVLKLLFKNQHLQAEIIIDENNYANNVIEMASTFNDLFDETYVTYSRKDDGVYANLVTTNVEKRFAELKERTNILVMMSGTLHSKEVLENIFKIKDFAVVEAETKLPGTIEVCDGGYEINCEYKKLKAGEEMRKTYLFGLSKSLEKAKRPVLVHVNAYADLPSKNEIDKYNISNLMPPDILKSMQSDDRENKMVSEFKNKKHNILFSTKCSRGVDFPGDICNSIVFTKYPNPNVQDLFWRILKHTYPNYFWSFYRDKARREFLQRIFRALRSKDDHVCILSPDSRVIEAARKLVQQP